MASGADFAAAANRFVIVAILLVARSLLTTHQLAVPLPMLLLLQTIAM